MDYSKNIKYGRPRMYNDPDEFDSECNAYFEACSAADEIPTTSGLALYLGFADRHSLYAYRQNETFSHVAKRAISKIERQFETRLSGTTPTGSIFWLKNHDWADRQEIKIDANEEAAAILAKRLDRQKTDE